jgi:hypothetical protein
MKVLWILGKVTALTVLMALGDAGAYAQAEIDPDHFDSLNTEPFDQPKTRARRTQPDMTATSHCPMPCSVAGSSRPQGNTPSRCVQTEKLVTAY